MTLPVAILAGGLATRLRPVTERIPKALIEVAGRPFVEHQIILLEEHGYKDIVLCVGYLGEMIERALGSGAAFGVNIRYAFDGCGAEKKLLGTGGALIKAMPLLGDAFMVLYGDSYLDCDYQAVEAAFRTFGKKGLMTVYRNDGKWDASNVIFRDNTIITYDKKNRSPKMRHIDYGLGVLSAEAFDGYPANAAVDLADVYGKLVAEEELAGFEIKERFYEIGSQAGIRETEEYILKKERGR
jgi:NDP-sugar pyrophosphorylase family protein